MFNPDFIFITFSFAILVGVSFWMKIPRGAIPLGLVYLIFIITNKNKNEIQENPNNFLTTTPTPGQVINGIIKPTSKPINPINNSIKLKHLQFDSGRTAKDFTQLQDAVQIEQKEKTPKTDQKNDEKTILLVRNIQICKAVDNRKPIGSDVFFSNKVDSLYCYTRIQNTGKKQEVRHNWYFENVLMTQIRYNVKKSNIYRSWSKKTIYSTQVGHWRVDIQDSNGNIIGSKTFEITDASIDH